MLYLMDLKTCTTFTIILCMTEFKKNMFINTTTEGVSIIIMSELLMILMSSSSGKSAAKGIGQTTSSVSLVVIMIEHYFFFLVLYHVCGHSNKVSPPVYVQSCIWENYYADEIITHFKLLTLLTKTCMYHATNV